MCVCVRAQIRLYKRAGMSIAAVEVLQDMQHKVDQVEKQRADQDAKLLRQKTLGMEMRQKARLSKVLESQERQQQDLFTSQEDEFTALVDAQAAEVHELQETVTGMITLGHAWAPVEKANRPWIAQLKKNRFRTSWKLSELQNHIDKLTGGASHVGAKVRDLEQQAAALLKSETEEWHEKLMTAALGEHTSSIQSQLVAQQKIAQAKMHDNHKQRTRLAEKQAVASVKMLNGQFRLEKLQLIEKFKIQRRQEALEEVADMGSHTLPALAICMCAIACVPLNVRH